MDAVTIRHYLQLRLPGYMIPLHVHFLDALPMNASGKVDRAALPSGTSISSGRGIPPRSPIEELVAGVWCDVLGLPSSACMRISSILAATPLPRELLRAWSTFWAGLFPSHLFSSIRRLRTCVVLARTRAKRQRLGPRGAGTGFRSRRHKSECGLSNRWSDVIRCTILYLAFACVDGLTPMLFLGHYRR